MDNSKLSSNWKILQQRLNAEKESYPVQPSGVNVRLKRKKEHGSRVEPIIKRQKAPNGQSKAAVTKGTSKMDQPSSRSRPRSTSAANEKAPIRDSSMPSRPSTSLSHVAQDPEAEENEGVSATSFAGRYIALDCEMVGVGPQPDQDSQVARVSLVNYHGEQLYDTYVKPTLPVTDYRTAVSGIRAHHLRAGRPFREVQADLALFLKGRILVGHYLKSDFSVLSLKHPPMDIRDTSRLQKFRNMNGGRNPKLKTLAKDVLGLDIQGGEHSSVEDARAAMLLYRAEKDAFEAEIKSSYPQPVKKTGIGKGIRIRSKSKKTKRR
jgi:RNA exonuclease 4